MMTHDPKALPMARSDITAVYYLSRLISLTNPSNCCRQNYLKEIRFEIKTSSEYYVSRYEMSDSLVTCSVPYSHKLKVHTPKTRQDSKKFVDCKK